jgi:general secretion pathway protein D
LRIIEASKSPRAQLPLILPGEAQGRDDGFVTRLVRLEHASVPDILAVLQGYRTEAGAVTGYAPAGTLILTDRSAAVDRLIALISALDVPGEAVRLWMIPARHLSAVDLAQTLAELTGVAPPAGRAGPRGAPVAAMAAPAPGAAAAASGIVRMIPDDRAGRLLVVATEAGFAKLVPLAARLDVPAETRAAKVHAYRCRHADCDAVAAILASLADVSVSRGPAPEGGARNRPAAPPAPAPASAPAGARPATAPLFAGDVRVTSDPSTNSLLVLSSLDDFRALRRLIEEVDVPRKQVFIEATILEVVRRKDRKITVGYHGGAASGSDGSVVGVGGFNAATTLLMDKEHLGSALVGLSGLALGAPLTSVARALGLPVSGVPSLGAFLQLLQRDEDVNLIANPNLLITNNFEGELSVGQKVPVQGAFTTSIGGASVSSLVPNISINREEVALSLKLTPHVNDDGLIRLEIDQELSELGADTPLGPTTSKRTARTTVFARDQQTVVIGGLQRERQTDSADKVPLLGDIPVLGVLFRSTTKAVEKQNIILALTPYVISDATDLTRVLEAKVRDRRDFLRLYGTPEERRLLLGPLGPPTTPGLLERIHRAVEELDEPAAPPSAPSAATADEGLPLPGS